MAKTLTLNDKSYNIEDLSDDAKRLATNILFAENKLSQLQSEAAVIQTARNAYTQALTAILEKPAESEEQSDSEKSD